MKILGLNMGVSKNGGTPKWMVYNGKPYFLTDDLEGFNPLFLETPNCIASILGSFSRTRVLHRHHCGIARDLGSKGFDKDLGILEDL